MLSDRGQEHLGRRAASQILQEVVLDGPDGIEAQVLRQLDLLDRLPVGVVLGLPGRLDLAGERDFVQEPEFHAASSRSAAARSRSSLSVATFFRTIEPGSPGAKSRR